MRLPTFDGMGLVVPDVSPEDLMPVEVLAELADDLGEAMQLLEPGRGDLRAGRLVDAIQIARALWTMVGSRSIHTEAAELLGQCYEALGRPTLAWVARTQARHRSLPNVDLLDQ